MQKLRVSGGEGDEAGGDGGGKLLEQDIRIIRPRVQSVTEDLGCVDFVFSDKTGTLTDNILNFRVCSIGTKSCRMSASRTTEAVKGRSRG